MTAFALIGAGPGLGLAAVRRFGNAGATHAERGAFRYCAEPMPA